MDMQWITLSTKGQLVIPADVRAELGIESGTRLALTVEGSRIILRPVNAQFVRETRGMFAGGPSMTDDLIRERRSVKDKF